jgi:hypothetical protein
MPTLIADVVARVALIAFVAFVGAILLDFIKAEHGGTTRERITLISGETMPIAIERDDKMPIATWAPMTTTRCR